MRKNNTLSLCLHYTSEAPCVNEKAVNHKGITEEDGWERWSLPIGNGYFGANVFGRTETERIQITEKTLVNPSYRTSPEGKPVCLGGLNNFSETYIDIGHPFSEVTEYKRYLDLKTAISGVSYSYNGVTYTRECFTSYPDKALVIRLDASSDGALSFVLRPTIPWKQKYAKWEGDGASKEGTVRSYLDGNTGVVELSGKMGYFDIDFMGLYRVVTKDGTVNATTCINEYGETDGTITVSGATSAYIYVTLGTDYVLTSEMFTASDKQKPTFKTTLADTRRKVEGECIAIAKLLDGKTFEDGYELIKKRHIDDYYALFGRVSLNIGDQADADIPTDVLLEKYKNGEKSRYLETLYFQYGRYLLIASSRKGALPANLQGTWNRYNDTPWGAGYWHNINVQMNYWHVFGTNLAEMFEAYVDYNTAYMREAEENATSYVEKNYPSQLGLDGGNGWCVATGAHQCSVHGNSDVIKTRPEIVDRSIGNLGFTTQLFWEYYQYTQDKNILKKTVFPMLVSAARYIVKLVELDDNGKYLSFSDSPEMFVDGKWYSSWGVTYSQTFAYQNNYNALLAAKELGIDLSDSKMINSEDLCVFKRVIEQIDKYDPISIGLSGQIKEFREEDYYCSVGDERKHRHISQLVGLYPANLINSDTPAWLDAARVTLNERGDNATGWGIAHRLNCWARTKDGNRAYKVLNSLLAKMTATNLWDICPPFEIDGNFGGTAGICEMLLQSHEGYIEPLAAIPKEWHSGSYSGLIARGNFEICASWKNGVAENIKIKSRSGNRVTVRYEGISTVEIIRSSDGMRIQYSAVSDDVIAFDTTEGEEYSICGFNKRIKKLAAPTGLNCCAMNDGKIILSWQTSEKAEGYRIYLATDSVATYALVAYATNTYVEYIPDFQISNSRLTFKVVAVDSNGIESDGALCYKNPIIIE